MTSGNYVYQTPGGLLSGPDDLSSGIKSMVGDMADELANAILKARVDFDDQFKETKSE